MLSVHLLSNVRVRFLFKDFWKFELPVFKMHFKGGGLN